jgi:hypothetical protein
VGARFFEAAGREAAIIVLNNRFAVSMKILSSDGSAAPTRAQAPKI